jgi:hypothetical protein
MSNKKNSLKYDHVIGNFIFHWEEKTRDGHAYLKIKTSSGGWQLRLRDDQECTMMWHRLLEDGECDKYLKTWLDSMEMVNTAIGDELFALHIAFARQTFVLRHAYIGDKNIASATEKNIKAIDEIWKKYIDAIPGKSADDATDESILESERKIRIDSDLEKQQDQEKEGRSNV